MAVGAQHDLHVRPVGPQSCQKTPQPFDDLASGRPAGGPQHGGNHAPLAVEDDDRLKAVFVVMRVEQTQLLAAMHGIERVVDVEHDARRHTAKTRAILVDHGTAHVQQRTPIGQVLEARNRRLRAQIRIVGQPAHRQLEHRIAAQRVGVVAILVASGNHQQAAADDLVQAMRNPAPCTRIDDATGKPPGNAKVLLHFAQCKQTAIRRHVHTVEAGDDRPAADG